VIGTPTWKSTWRPKWLPIVLNFSKSIISVDMWSEHQRENQHGAKMVANCS